ncbi:MAG: CopG family transcriptional regulator (plasmid) [Nodularia sp. CChRGM 3473]
MVKTLVAKDYRVKPGTWGESKQRVQIMLTPTAIELVDAMAEKMELTRAEVIERLIRSQCLNVETLKEIAGDDD